MYNIRSDVTKGASLLIVYIRLSQNQWTNFDGAFVSSLLKTSQMIITELSA